ncbi:MAG: GDSL-type esterase/lipase family protein [Deltaproteobacteria bacterium]|nr:GDSL-type esterase/lipase family protein [Deltaproteobacteria bacterium]
MKGKFRFSKAALSPAKTFFVLILGLAAAFAVSSAEPAFAQSARKTVVMLGDSLTAGGVWSRLDQRLHFVNLGVSGDGVADVLRRLSLVEEAEPDLVFLQVGINDLAAGLTSEHVLAGHQAIWRQLLSARPNLRLIVCSLLPIGERFRNSQQLNQIIVKFNAALFQAVREAELEWVDLHSAMSDPRGYLPDFLSTDGIHLSEKGYEYWRAVLAPFLAAAK